MTARGTGRRLAVGLAAGALVLTACESAAERLTESATERLIEAGTDGEVDLDLSEGGFTVEDGEGGRMSVGATQEVPERVAAVVPLPDGYEPVNTFEQRDGDQDAVTVGGHLETDDPVGVLDAIEAQMTADGWETEGRSNMNDQMLSLALTRGEDAVTVSLLRDGDDDEAMLNVVLVTR